MARRWGWTAVHAGGRPFSVGTYPHLGFFATPQHARQHLQSVLDGAHPASTAGVAAALLRTAPYTAGEIILTCPPSDAWLIYPVDDDISAEQAASASYRRNMPAIWKQLDARKTENRITVNDLAGGKTGCVVVALTVLGVVGAVAASWARIRGGF